ncbi:peroxiredoxin [Flavobacterium sp. F-380]|uniref:thioredoxin-dependent peroxiredoxin n=1 Tax=Flavobacterium kayseriense TaxID=2764714 RepID=A0ABR7J797_9FLAO|nr:peroxiredoxin [Flavobacterium kayseriense]MBC5841390.1 peroxiredoxin [Flavobacterium kayseriense]MBC5847918.1 peroxiredoxin [Flavobacterium kayseriense]
MALKVGDKIPNFTAIKVDGTVFESTSIVGEKVVVIYFYPKDNTSQCTAQACDFRDKYQDFKDLGAEVIGISSDGIASHEKFKQQYKLPFILLSDQDKKIQKMFGVPKALFGILPGRVTYVADKNGIIIMIFNNIMAANHIPKALRAVKKSV